MRHALLLACAWWALVAASASAGVGVAAEVGQPPNVDAKNLARRHGHHAGYDATDLSRRVFSGGFAGVMGPALDEVKRAVVARVQAQSGVLGLGGDDETKLDEAAVHLSHHWVTMRDGVRLSTLLFLPKRAADGQAKVCTVIGRSPYGPTSDQIADLFMLSNGCAAVVQDQRGAFLSEGEFSLWRHDGEDGFDTINWVTSQPWSNGDAFTVGISADACGTAALMLTAPKQLKGQLLMWGSGDGHATTFPGGAFREGLVGGWMSIMAALTHGVSLEKTLPDILRHEELGASDWWDPIQMARHVDKVTWPTVHITAHWDIFQGHQMEMFNALRAGSAIGPDAHSLIVGPLGHCMLGNLDAELAIQEMRGIVNGFGLAAETFAGTTANGHFSKRLDRVNVYMQGSRKDGRRGPNKVGGFWTSVPAWPATKPVRLLLTQNKGLLLHGLEEDSRGAAVARLQGMEAATTATSRRRRLRHGRVVTEADAEANKELAHKIGDGHVEFVYDPLLAEPTHGGNNLIITFLGFGCASEDQRRVERRPDTVVFDMAEPLKAPLALLGRMRASLWVSTNRNDTDFHVSVTDVHPDGSSMQIRFGLQRMRWRDSTPLKSVLTQTEPNVATRVDIDLWWTGYVVAPGHRLRVAVSSSNNPYYAKNDNSGTDVLGLKQRLPARNRVFFSAEMPSHVELPVVDLADVPRNELF